MKTKNYNITLTACELLDVKNLCDCIEGSEYAEDERYQILLHKVYDAFNRYLND